MVGVLLAERALADASVPATSRAPEYVKVHLRLKPGASLVVVHHRLPSEFPVKDQ